jgi:hypothetical protein
VPYIVWENIVPRTINHITEGVVYLYPSIQSGNQSKEEGGTGFLVAIEAPVVKQHIYAVTNKHVAKDNPFIRLNTHYGGHDILEGQWTFHKDGDDVAACKLRITHGDFRFVTIDAKQFITPVEMRLFDVGLGDDLLMVGRFVNIGGEKRNLPTLRFGTIARMLDEPIYDPEEKRSQEGFLAEVRTIPGYSGSPVIVHIDRKNDPDFVKQFGDKPIEKLLGIEWCRVPMLDEVRTQYLNNMRIDVHVNTGMSGVIPAWKITQLLNCQDFREERQREEEMELEKRRKPQSGGIEKTSARPTQRSHAPNEKDRIDIPIPSRDDVMDVFKKATRKRDKK